jgi:hypothetical protein
LLLTTNIVEISKYYNKKNEKHNKAEG